jgi:hypothetical protein
LPDLLLRMGLYMFITEEEAVDMYARARRRWYGDQAKSVVNSKIGTLRAIQDVHQQSLLLL